MAVYIYREEEIEGIIRAQQRLRLRFCVAVFILLLAACVVALTRPEWIFGAHERARLWVIGALFVFFAGPLGENLVRWRSRPAQVRESLARTSIEVSESGIRMEEPGQIRQLARNEIVRAEETPWGLYLRTCNRYHWMLISKRIGEFDTLKREIGELEIPLVQAASAPNWEELAGVLIFTATMVCAIFAQSVAMLAANLGVAILIAIAGFKIVSANPDNLPKMRWARLGIFLPVLMTAAMLWSRIRG